jgi:NADP-reducing hydrogenase subunit HndB
MPRITIDDLKKIKEEARHKMVLRAGEARARVTVHMSTCGIAAGAREVLDAFLKEVEARKLADVLVTTSSCAGLCSREPMATVDIAGRPPVKYVDLNPAKSQRVLAEHVVGGAVVKEYALAAGSETAS